VALLLLEIILAPVAKPVAVQFEWGEKCGKSQGKFTSVFFHLENVMFVHML